MNLVKGVVNLSNIHKICKICLEEKPQIFSVFSIIAFKETSVPPISISDILTKITAQKVTKEDVPSLICIDCMNDLKSAYIFILKYEEALQIIKNYLCNHIKDESLDNDDSELTFNFAQDKDSDAEIDNNRYETRSSCKKQSNPANKPKKRGRKKKIKVEDDDFNENRKDDIISHTCPICTKEFNALDLIDHAHTHKALKKYLTIPASAKVSPTMKFFNNQVENSTISLFNKANKLHKCPYCNQDFPVSEFRVHIDVHRKQTEFKCDKCERVFKKLNHLNTHRVKHLKEFPYKCEQCGKGFVIETNYDCHMLTHKNEELPHECKFCFKRFSNPEHLNRHQIIHTENVTYSVKYKVCKCHHCLKTFKDKDELRVHTCVPIDQAVNTRFPCKTCKKVFKHSSGLYNHNRNIHKLKGAKTLCSVCGNYVSNIYNHMMRHTGEKPYQCNQCEKRFIAKPQLRQHLLVHSGLKPYVCSVCAKAFNNLYNLQVHERIHKGDRCHICNICNKGFLEKSYLKKHMNVHSKIN